MRQLLKVICWAIVGFGIIVLTLLMNNRIQPALWTGIAVFAAFPAFILAGIVRTNDLLRRQGFQDREIPTSKGRLARSVLRSIAAGLAAGISGGAVLYLLTKGGNG